MNVGLITSVVVILFIVLGILVFRRWLKKDTPDVRFDGGGSGDNFDDYGDEKDRATDSQDGLGTKGSGKNYK